MKCVRCLPVTTHIGGDENNGKEWNANPTIQEFKKKNEITSNHDTNLF
jgi:hexosaminidase